MPEPLISVVVPVYRVEAFLDRCVESICAQTYRELEIILSDDGSPDTCGALCDAWAARDGRVRVLHKENGGLSDARNAGVALARGAYLFFVDSDDYLAPDAIGYLYGLLEKTGAEIAVGAYRRVSDGGERFDNQPEEETRVWSAAEAVSELMRFDHYEQLVTAWGKLYAACLVRDNPFPVGRLHEDEATTYKYYDQAEKTVLSNRVVYAYFQNPGSIMHNRGEENRRQTLLAYEEQLAYFSERGEHALASAAADRFVNVVVDLADKGDPVCRDYVRAGKLRPCLALGLRKKTLLRYRGYTSLGVDLTKLYNSLRGRGTTKTTNNE